MIRSVICFTLYLSCKVRLQNMDHISFLFHFISGWGNNFCLFTCWKHNLVAHWHKVELKSFCVCVIVGFSNKGFIKQTCFLTLFELVLNSISLR